MKFCCGFIRVINRMGINIALGFCKADTLNPAPVANLKCSAGSPVRQRDGIGVYEPAGICLFDIGNNVAVLPSVSVMV